MALCGSAYSLLRHAAVLRSAAPIFHLGNHRNLSISSTFAPEKSVAKEGYTNRWAIAVPAFLTHLCIGMLYTLADNNEHVLIGSV